MMRHYNICGLGVKAEFREKIMTSRSEKYLSDGGKADISIPYNPEGLAVYRNLAPNLPEEELELIYTAEVFYKKLLSFNGFMLHSSAVELDGKAYLFSAPSGTGKSTHTELWLKHFGERARIINDDKPAIRIIGGRVYAYGTPWSGKSDLNLNVGVPLQGICVLERSEKNFIEPLDEGTAVFSILNQTLRPAEEKSMEKLLELLDKVIVKVPVWRMGCNISEEAAAMAYEAMK